MTAHSRKLLVTGGTGVLGPSLLSALGCSRCIVLRHRSSVSDPAVELIDGDLSQPHLGIGAAAYRRLLGQIEGIVHAGAITSSLQPAAEVEDVNVLGTRHVVELAEQASVPLHHISTFYVRGRDGSHTSPAVDPYQASKRRAEGVVEGAATPTAIYRLPILIGDTQTGVISRFTGQAFYLAAKTIVSGNAHVMPVAGSSYLDFLPRDHVARCLRAAIDGGVRGVFWITAGSKALRFTDFVEICVEVAEELGRSVVRPKLLAPDVVERLVLPVFGESIPRAMLRQLELANRVMLGVASETHLPDSRRELPAGVEFPRVPDLRASLRASLRYWAANTTLPQPIKIPELAK